MSGAHDTTTWQAVARIFDVPPWLVSEAYPVPRFPRLRWKLRRVWPIRFRDVPPPRSFLAAEAMMPRAGGLPAMCAWAHDPRLFNEFPSDGPV